MDSVVRGRLLAMADSIERNPSVVYRRPSLLFERNGRGVTLTEAGKRLLRRGILALTEGPSGDVLAITPPLVIDEAQLDHALDVIEEEVRR